MLVRLYLFVFILRICIYIIFVLLQGGSNTNIFMYRKLTAVYFVTVYAYTIVPTATAHIAILHAR